MTSKVSNSDGESRPDMADDRLDAALAVGFNKDSEPVQIVPEPRVTLPSSERLPTPSRVMLRDLDETTIPVTLAFASECPAGTDRYQVFGEIAREGWVPFSARS